MLVPRAHRRVQPRRFSYTPRFYDPSKDERIKRRMRFERKGGRRTKQPAFILVALLFVLAFYLYLNAESLTSRTVEFSRFFFGG